MNFATRLVTRFPRQGLWILVPAVALVGVLHAGASSAPVAAAAPQPVPVTLAVARSEPLPLWLDAIGTVTSLNAVSIRPRVDGQLQAVRFVEGQAVKAGDLLAVLDPRPLQAQLEQSQALRAQAEAKVASSKVDLERAAALAQAGAGPTQAVDTLRAQVQTETAAVQAARAAVDSAQLQLGFTRITSPIDGRAGQKLVALGSTLHAADTTGIVTITQMNPIWVSFSLPQDQLPEILRESAGRPLKVSAAPRDGSQPPTEGELVFVDSQVTPTNGQVQLKARFDNRPPALWPGELVAVRLLLRTQAEATVVPQQAVQQGPNGAFVYVANPRHLAELRNVTAGEVVNGKQWIRSGVVPGESVVTQGQYRLAPGLPVATTTSTVAAGAQP